FEPQLTNVGPLEDHHATIAPQSLMELAPSHVHGHDLGRTPGEQAVDEPPRRRAGVEGLDVAHADPELGESGIELLTSPAHERWWRPANLDRLGGGHHP